MADARRQYTELTDRARNEAEQAAAGRATHDRFVAEGGPSRRGWCRRPRSAQAAREAARIVDAADAEADRLRRECDAYVDAKLAELEESLGKALPPSPAAARACGGAGRPVPGRACRRGGPERAWT